MAEVIEVRADHHVLASTRRIQSIDDGSNIVADAAPNLEPLEIRRAAVTRRVAANNERRTKTETSIASLDEVRGTVSAAGPRFAAVERPTREGIDVGRERRRSRGRR